MRASRLGIAVLLSTTALLGCKKPPLSSDPATRLEECETLDGRAAADDCYEKLGVSAHKPGYCERIVGPRVKNACFEKVAALVDNPEVCTKVDETATRTSCRSAIAKKRGNAAVCASIERIEGQAICTREVAVAKKDVKICEGIAVVETRIECITRAAAGNPTACQAITDKVARDRCLAAVVIAGAGTAADPACALLLEPLTRDECWATAARGHRTDDALCAKIEAPASADRCHLDIAQNLQSVAPCDNIADVDRKASCITDIAKRNTDDTLCAKIVDPVKQASCVRDVKPTPASASLNTLRKGITRLSDDHYEVTRATVDHFLTNQSELMRTSRMVPEMRDGKTTGIRLFGIRPDSAMAALGFENGDTLERINGFDITAPDKALEAYAQLRTTTELLVQMTRRGAARKVTYTIK